MYIKLTKLLDYIFLYIHTSDFLLYVYQHLYMYFYVFSLCINIILLINMSRNQTIVVFYKEKNFLNTLVGATKGLLTGSLLCGRIECCS